MQYDTAFQMSASNIRFGSGTTREVGMDLQDLGVRRVLLVIDPALVDLPTGQVALESLRASGLDFDVFYEVEVEPTDQGF
ncbi:MAG: iron-containing alcohol dehydrogenase, partial [Pirellulaceae bacterium]